MPIEFKKCKNITYFMILITGASGFVGRNLVRHLNPRSSIRCLVRKTSDARGLEGCELVEGDITDKDSLFAATRDVDAVIHLVAALGASTYKENCDVHVGGAKNLAEACKANGVKRLVVASSVATLAERKSDYGITKKMADEVFMASGLDVTILKPDFIYGRDGKGFLTLVEVIRRHRFIPIVGNGRYRRQPVHVDDVCKAFFRALRSESIGKTYVVASEKPIEFNEMVDMIMRKLGVRKRKVHFPVLFMLLAAKAMKLRKTKLTQTVVLGIAQDRNEDITPLVKELGVHPIGFEEGLKKSLG